MADIDVLRVLLAIIFLFFVPGYFLWKALVPRPRDVAEEFPLIHTVAFSMVLSVALIVLVGIALGQLPVSGGQGFVKIEYEVPALLLLSAVFGAIGWWRGAFPALGRLSKRLERHPAAPPDGSGVADDSSRYGREQNLLSRRLELRAELGRKARAGRAASEDRGYYQKRRGQLTEDLVQVDEELVKLRAERARMLDEAEAKAVKLEERRRERRDTLLRFLRLKRAAPDDAPPSEGK